MQFTLQDAWDAHNRGDFGRAATICNQLLSKDSGNAAILGCRAMSNWSRRYAVDEALSDMARVVKLAPAVAGHRHNYATILASVGRLDEAQAEFRTALDLNPKDSQAFYGLAQNTRFTGEDAAVQHMRVLCDAGELSGVAREFACFGLAKIYSDLGRPEEAFRFAVEANKLGARPYDLRADETRLAQLKDLAGSGLFGSAESSGLRDKTPIFVVGMPRSGTTLVESILARHPDVFAAGELPFMPQVEARMVSAITRKGAVDRGPDFALLDVPAAQFRRWADAILEEVAKMADDTYPVFTDKLPHNAIRLGLIAKLFPEARIIHVRRNPLDTGLSNFFMRFHAGHGYANHLDQIGTQFRIIADSVAEWKNIAGIHILDVRYENLVDQAEPEVRRLLDFAGLEFNAECLHPDRGHRGVMTASQWQVRQPIYNRSVARWQPFEPWLEPMIAALGGRDWIAAYDQK